MTGVLRILGALIIAYVALAAALWAFQRSMLYFPDRTPVEPAAFGVPATLETIRTADGETIRLWVAPPRENKAVVIHLHGNGGNHALWSGVFRDLISAGHGLVSVSYRGYGGSTGSPTEAGLIEDARAAYAFARIRFPGARIALYGDSLGTAVATALAVEAEIVALVLNAPVVSVEDRAAEIYRFLPVRLLIADRFLTRERIGKVRAPILILHGSADEVTPASHGERLFALAPEPKRFLRIVGGRHTDLWSRGAREAILAFLEAMEGAPMLSLLGLAQLNRR